MNFADMLNEFTNGTPEKQKALWASYKKAFSDAAKAIQTLSPDEMAKFIIDGARIMDPEERSSALKAFMTAFQAAGGATGRPDHQVAIERAIVLLQREGTIN